MNKTKAIILDSIISILLLLMIYAFYLGNKQIFYTLVYILASYGFIHFVVDSYGFILQPVPEEKHQTPVKKENTKLTASEMLANRIGVQKEDPQ